MVHLTQPISEKSQRLSPNYYYSRQVAKVHQNWSDFGTSYIFNFCVDSNLGFETDFANVELVGGLDGTLFFGRPVIKGAQLEDHSLTVLTPTRCFSSSGVVFEIFERNGWN